MNCPTWLENKYARKFWFDQSKPLIEQGVLTEQNVESFGLMCEIWGELRSLDKSDTKSRIYYINLLKQFQHFAKSFKAQDKPMDIAAIIREGMGDAEQA